ncbi:MAG TPA: hypothetical protein DIT07_11785 [Sphingobacteriaceae bacterium]|nr:hypothetical protein [Sphingobacteriaceae bacterium]
MDLETDLRNQYNEAINNLKSWRNRYSKSEYPEKVVKNIFYGNLTMEISCGDVSNYFSGKLTPMSFEYSYKLIEESFEKIAIEKSQRLLPVILKDRAYIPIGNIKYETFLPQIRKASLGANNEIEDIEFAYVFYYLSNICVRLWCALGITGLNKIDAIAKLSGAVIETREIQSYAHIEDILGKLIVAPLLNEIYKPMNKLF